MIPEHAEGPWRWSWLATLAVVAFGLAVHSCLRTVPLLEWLQLWNADLGDADHIVALYSTAPRIVMALVAGVALGLSGAVFQQVLRNPLAEPGLLGVSAGAQLALAASLLYAPALWTYGQEAIAFGGAAVALAVVLAVAAARRLAPATITLAGLVVSLYCSALFALLVLFHHDFLQDILTWQAGSLQQNGWDGVRKLLPRVVLAAAIVVIFKRPLTLLSLGDAQATSLGLSATTAKVVLLVIAAALAAFVTSTVGLIAFVGLAAPNLARIVARTPGQHLAWSAVSGALILLGLDQFLASLAPMVGDIPTGAAAGLLTGPLLVLLAARRPIFAAPTMTEDVSASHGSAPKRDLLFTGFVLLAVLVSLSLTYGRFPDGWRFAKIHDLDLILTWRLPRVMAAAGAGSCLALAGLLLQRTTRNPMASPELLGIGYGAGLGLVIAMIVLPADATMSKLAAASAGAALAIGLTGWLSWNSEFRSERMLLIGAAFGGIFSSVIVLMIAAGHPQAAALLSWFSGSTAGVDREQAVAVCLCALMCTGAALLLQRWLTLHSLGTSAGRALGLSNRTSRAAIFIIASLATGAATVVAGPLSFIGLMVPHLVRMTGVRRLSHQIAGAAIFGAVALVAADWVGRNGAYPWPMSPGLLAAAAGGPYLLWLLSRR
jgi:ABC-type Fe3+-siderophore transport system permease subunit